MKKFNAGVAAIAIIASAQNAFAADAPAAASVDADSADAADIVITGAPITYAQSDVTPQMIERQATIASVNTVISELPGVFVSEADAFGSADWVTNITIRGFSTNDGHVGTTIDGLPNGGSGYGGGSKANRYLDVQNLQTVAVSQGTADIASRTNESLGGTLDYQTSDPKQDRRYRFSLAGGDFGGRKIYALIDTGEIAPGTFAWISASTSHVKDWVAQSDTTSRDHVAAKLTSDLGKVNLSGYVSFDDANEGEYGSVSLTNFKQNPDFDGLTANWTGIPYIDQNFRSGSRALRKNLFGYLRANADLGEVKLVASAYGHKMSGRGDWLPPYLVDITNDGAGNPNSEFNRSGTVFGGSTGNKIFFVTPTGATAPTIAGCVPAAGIPADYAPNCHDANATPVMSYRHTHYKNRRLGAVLDVNWEHDFGAFQNLLRAGLWYENGKSNVVRDWHKVTDARVSYQFDAVPYYVQYDRDYGINELVYYADNSVTFGDLTARAGLKQYRIRQDRSGNVGDALATEMNYNSKVLFSGGVNYRPLPGLEVFAGYAQNFAALRRSLLDETENVRREIKPETADSIEGGVRYSNSRFMVSATVYDIKFNNRVIFVPSNFVTGIDYLSEVDGIYLNVGGVKSTGIELAAGYRITPELQLSTSYSYNRAKYLGTGDAAKDAALDIVPGVQVYNTPKHMLVGALDWKGDIFKAGISSKYVSSRFIDRQGVDPSGSFVLTNAYVGVELGEVVPQLKNLDLSVTVNNLTNERYLAGADGGSAFLGSPRTVMASLTLDF
ncbi:MAG: TonB-dependent receptor [Sphingomonadales bacterium]|nr:TonB-dependent receptor [Sphingomonadales bacterium]